VRLALARHNAALYGVVDRIEFVLADFISFARALPTVSARTIDVVFLSPPWGGVDYQSLGASSAAFNGDSARRDSHSVVLQEGEETRDNVTQYSLNSLTPLSGTELFTLARRITPNVALFLPRNQDLREVSNLVTPGSSNQSPAELVEVEEEWMGNKLKALTCYFGGLAQGQGHLWR
jgi:trimethylguanosine synthase